MLSPSAQKVIHDYFNLPFLKVDGVRCPYFNNARAGTRGQLRVLIGKGSPKEIVEEAKIISIQYCKGIFDVNGMCCIHPDQNEHPEASCLYRFLIDNNLGVDCSGFITHVLTAHYKEAKGINLPKKIIMTLKLNFFKKLIAKLRPIEHINVGAYAIDPISAIIKLKDAQPGDLIIMLETGPKNERNH